MMKYALLAFLVLLGTASAARAEMTMSFDWGPTEACFDTRTPPITLSGVPQGTTALDVRMVDLQAPRYPHGGGQVAYNGADNLPYGAVEYKGPCPPEPHTYRITVTALGADGQVLGNAYAERQFPE